jgi:hypothetical protein
MGLFDEEHIAKINAYIAQDIDSYGTVIVGLKSLVEGVTCAFTAGCPLNYKYEFFISDSRLGSGELCDVLTWIKEDLKSYDIDSLFNPERQHVINKTYREIWELEPSSLTEMKRYLPAEIVDRRKHQGNLIVKLSRRGG